MIAIVIRECSYLKALAPIIHHLHECGVEYVLYHFDAPRGDKEYNRATLPKLNKAFPEVSKHVNKVRAFANDKALLQMLGQDKITKLVSLEIWLWAKGYVKQLKQLNIKTYSISYLSDSLWQPAACVNTMDRVYYSSKYLMEIHHKFAGVKYSPVRDKLMSPIFDPLQNKPSEGKNILVLLPNLKKEHVKGAFGNENRFIKIIEKLSQTGKLIFKTRKKQWMPNEIKQYAKEIIDDGDVMYPPVISGLLERCYCSVMFYSSGVYECIYSGNYVYNIALPIKRWPWDKRKMEQYFSTVSPSVYQFPGVVESISQDTLLGDWKFEPKHIDTEARNKWVGEYIGEIGGAKQIILDIMGDK